MTAGDVARSKVRATVAGLIPGPARANGPSYLLAVVVLLVVLSIEGTISIALDLKIGRNLLTATAPWVVRVVLSLVKTFRPVVIRLKTFRRAEVLCTSIRTRLCSCL